MYWTFGVLVLYKVYKIEQLRKHERACSGSAAKFRTNASIKIEQCTVFLTLQKVVEMCILHNDNKNCRTTQLSNAKLERERTLPVSILLSDDFKKTSIQMSILNSGRKKTKW